MYINIIIIIKKTAYFGMFIVKYKLEIVLPSHKLGTPIKP